jgi:lipoate-protein ligase B
VPCGLATEGVTSLAALGVAADMVQARTAVRGALSEVFEAELIDDVERPALQELLAEGGAR